MTSVSSFLWQILPIFLAFLTASDVSLAKPVVPSSYAQHCGSIAPESLPTTLFSGASSSFLISNGLFSAGNRINNLLFPSTNFFSHDAQFHGYFHFQPGQVHHTHDDGTLQLEGTLVLIGSRVPRNHTYDWRNELNNRRRVVFKLLGFWSEAKEKLCMVGTGEILASKNDQVASPLSVVLKLEYPKVSKIKTSIIKGSVESLNTDTTTHFESVSLLAFAQRNYEYTMSGQAEESCSHVPHGQSVGADSTYICSNLKRAMQAETFTASNLVNLLEFGFLSINQLVCREDGKVHLSMKLSNESKPFRRINRNPILPGKLLVAEGAWNHHNSKLCLIACRVVGKDINTSVVEDCFLSLTFWFPKTFSLKQRSIVVGHMLNTSDVSNNRENKIVSLYSIDSYTSYAVPGLKYEYTQLDRARKNCRNKNVHPKKIGRYPNARSQTDMTFHLSIKNLTNGKSAWGAAKLISIGETYIGNEHYGIINGDSMYTIGDTKIQTSSSLADQNHEVWDVGYTIDYTFWDTDHEDSVYLSAEGIYNSTTGTLCLVGCRQPSFSYKRNGKFIFANETMSDNNLDCKFFIQLQLPPLDSKEQQKGAGTISSTRDDSDPMYFKPLDVTFYIMYRSFSIQEYGRMDAEMIMVIISLSILCICSYLQLRQVTKHTTIQHLMSITMLVVLTGGSAVALVLNMEATLVPNRKKQRDVFFVQSSGWVDTTNTIARLLTIVVLLISYRLLQLAWGSRSKEESATNTSCNAERKSLMFCVPLYIVGALFAWYIHSKFFMFRRTTVEELARYVGLLVDNFLLPQIIFNVFSESKENVLNPFFYFGVTMVRVVPHIYDVYRAWWYPVTFYNPSYIYANYDGDYYSTLLDLIIPLEGLLFVLLVYLQQKFGGRCFLPKRFKGGVSYEPVCDSNI